MRDTIAMRECRDAVDTAIEFAEIERPKLGDMLDWVFLEAHRLTGSQYALMIAGIALEPDQNEVERIARLLAVSKFLQNCRDEPDKAIEWLRGRRK